MITTQINIYLVYPNNLRQHTIWSMHKTIIDIFLYIQRSCTQFNRDIMIQSEEYTFKTSESYSCLTKQLLLLNMNNDIEFNIIFY